MLDATPPDDDDLSDFQLSTLSGDVRDAVLARFRSFDKCWRDMNEAEQNDAAHALDFAAREAVKRVVRLITDYEWPSVAVEIRDMKVVPGDKARIEAKVIAERADENMVVLGKAVGTHAMLLMIDSATFLGERAPVRTDADQPDLPLDPEAPAEEPVAGSDPSIWSGAAEPDEEIAEESGDFAAHLAELQGDGAHGELTAQTTRGRSRKGS